MYKLLAVLIAVLLLSGCDKGEEPGSSVSAPDAPSHVERVEEDPPPSSGEEPGPEPAPEPLEQPDLTAEEAQILLVPDAQGMVPIATPEDLMALAALVNSGDESHRDMTFVMQKNINLSGIDFIPIGGTDADGNSFAFQGAFDGDGYRINNLTIRDNGNPNCTGLFGLVGGTGSVSNLHLVSGDITGQSIVGGVAGTVSGRLYNCSFGGVITAEGIAVGGVAGQAHPGEDGEDGGEAVIAECFANADITAGGMLGGLVGVVQAGASVRDSYALGEVNVVDGDNSVPACIGGFAGDIVGTVDRCFSNTEVYAYASPTLIGGFAGQVYEDGVTGCYFNKTATENWNDVGSWGEEEFPGLTPCTVAELVEPDTYSGWDFAAVWEMDGEHNRGLPFLRAAELK